MVIDRLIVLAAIALATQSARSGTILYVDDSAPPGGGDGATWATALDDLEEALAAAAEPGSPVDEIWVAEGLYVPSMRLDPDAPRSATFQPVAGLTLYGGFVGNESSVEERDIDSHPTVLSGDLQGDDGPGFTNVQDNAYHVVYLNDLEGTVVLDGFVIRAGNAVEDFSTPLNETRGAGVYVVSSDATLRQCVLRDNQAQEVGGGLVVASDAAATIEDCLFLDNRAVDPFLHDAKGGAIWVSHGVLTITRCTFLDNHVLNNIQQGGGAIYAFFSDLSISASEFIDNSSAFSGGAIFTQGFGETYLAGCVFRGNEAQTNGGAVMITTNEPTTLVRCIFVDNHCADSSGALHAAGGSPNLVLDCGFFGNTAGDEGGAMRATRPQTLVNCVFSGNASQRGGGALQAENNVVNVINSTLYGNTSVEGAGGVFVVGEGDLTVTNSILWANTGAAGSGELGQALLVHGAMDVRYSVVQGLAGLNGLHNIGDDPLFVDPDGPDGVPGTEDDDLRLSNGSPCIDAADNTAVPAATVTDFAGDARFADDPGVLDTGNGAPPVVDMGALERLAACPWDLNGNGVVDIADLLTLLFSFGPCDDPADCPVDFDGNGAVDVIDLLALLWHYGSCPGFACRWDFNRDGIVDFMDLQEMIGHMGQCEDPDNCPWDLTGDGFVGIHDILELLSNLGPCDVFADCNSNGTADAVDIADLASEDCNGDGVPDECDLEDGTSLDCNGNNVPDECDIAAGFAEDCNGNGVPDDCDIQAGTSSDFNNDGTPDECEPAPPNDDCENAAVISDGPAAFSTLGASTDGFPTLCEGGQGLSFVNDVWFIYTATCQGTVTFSTCNAAGFDTRVAVGFLSPQCLSFTPLACSDNAPGCFLSSEVAVFAFPGLSYLVRVGATEGSGVGVLTVTCEASPGGATDSAGVGSPQQSVGRIQY